MQNAHMYEQMLGTIGILQNLSETAQNQETETAAPDKRCCDAENNIVVRGGSYVCYECGRVTDNYQYIWYQPTHKGAGALGANNTITITRKRWYSSVTHFKEHLRRYMGARFTEFPEHVLKLLADVDVQKRDTYHVVQAILRRNGFRHMYKEIFMFIYKLGGVRPNINHTLFEKCVNDFRWLNEKFKKMKSDKETTRKNMPSMYVIMDMLLHRNGHTPYYTIPNLKDKNLRAQIMNIYFDLSHDLA